MKNLSSFILNQFKWLSGEDKPKLKLPQNQKKCITTAEGIPVQNPTSSITVGKHGPIVLYDTNLIESLAQFNRERIPERVVHAKGSAAFGYFETTEDITEYTTSKVFEIGKRTPIAVRFSRVAGSLGSADTELDPRGEHFQTVHCKIFGLLQKNCSYLINLCEYHTSFLIQSNKIELF